MLPLRNVSLPSTSCRSGEAMSTTAISSGSSNGHACDRSGHAVDAYCVAKYGQRVGLGWTETDHRCYITSVSYEMFLY